MSQTKLISTDHLDSIEPCIDVSDCCSGANVCAPPLDNPEGQSACRYDPCLDGSTVISPGYETFTYYPFFYGRLVGIGSVEDLVCCRACYATAGCGIWFYKGGYGCIIDITVATRPPTGVSAQCPHGLAPPLAVYTTDLPLPIGRGPCIDPAEITVI